MNKEWYNIDVKREILTDIQEFLFENPLKGRIIEILKEVSVRDMMDISFVSKIEALNNPEDFTRYVSDRYMHYRSEKYGQEGFWESAATERSIGYNGAWYEHITALLKKYCELGDKVLFVGTADGKEIPSNHCFDYYALEQIGISVNSIDESKVVECFEADFEDDSFIIGNGKEMKALVALRCLMPNTRLEHFFRFVNNNIGNEGVLIVSHPMGFLDKNNEYKALPNCRKTLKEFDERFKKELFYHKNMNVVFEEETNVEYFYIIKVD